MFIFAAIQRPNELPVVNVLAFVLILVSIIPVWLATRISGAETAGARL
jgi:putative spermidine/putrescine transport system permease protein